VDTIFPGGFTGQEIILAGVGFAAVIVMYVVWNALLLPEDFSGRLKALQSRRSRLKSDAAATTRRRGERRLLTVGTMRSVLGRFESLKGNGADDIRAKLQQAGFRSSDAIIIYQFMRLCLPFVFGFIMVMVVYVLEVFPFPEFLQPVLCFGATLLGFKGPEIYVRNTAIKRTQIIGKALPDGLDLLTICVEAGLSLDMALTRVAKEMQGLSAELAYELQMTAIELTFLPDRQQAFENLANRNDLPGVRALVNAFRQTEKFGTPLAQSLRVLSAEFRNERMMKAEEKGARLPAMMTVPMMIFILPTLFIIIMGPGIISIIDTVMN
jgi:tight adherence protein C